MSVLSTAPGKIIVTGEYVGIFGEPVTLTTVNLYTKTKINLSGNDITTITSDRFPGEKSKVKNSELLELWKSALSDYKKYLVGSDVGYLSKYRQEKLGPIALAAACALSSLKDINFNTGVNIEVASILPIGSGLGSSASVCASIIGGVFAAFEQELKKSDLNALTYEVEKILNGSPSGADNSAVIYGGWLRFQRNNNQMNVTKITGLGEVKNWWLVDGGKPEETTLDLISRVLELNRQNKNKVMELIGRDRKITEQVQHEIKEGSLNPDFLKESQEVLEEFGVIGEHGKQIIRAINNHGGMAKVSGAGGIKSGVGMIMCYHPDEDSLKRLALEQGIRYSPLILGGSGWKIEK